MSVRVIITGGTTADCTMALPLISGLDSAYVLADKRYDSQEFVDSVMSRGAELVIPPRRCRKEQQFYDKHLYLVENEFLRLKELRGVATRYAKGPIHFF